MKLNYDDYQSVEVATVIQYTDDDGDVMIQKVEDEDGMYDPVGGHLASPFYSVYLRKKDSGEAECVADSNYKDLAIDIGRNLAEIYYDGEMEIGFMPEEDADEDNNN